MWFLLASLALADDWPAPKPVELTSPDGRWTVQLTPGKGGSTPTCELSGPGGGATWDLKNTTAPVDAVLLDSGVLLTFDEWHQLGIDTVARAYDPDGAVRWERTLEQLLDGVDMTGISRSVSSRWWRRTPLEWTMDGDRVVVVLWDENTLAIDPEVGRSEYRAVGADPDWLPEKLLRRIEGLAATDAAAALTLADTAVAKNPNDIGLHQARADLLAQADRHADVVASVGPLVEAELARPGGGYPVVNLACTLATSLQELGKKAEAEQVLRKAAPIEPTYKRPTELLARVVADRPDVVVEVVEAFVAQNEAAGGYSAQRARIDAGGIYRWLKMDRRAQEQWIAARAMSPANSVDIHLYVQLAEVSEALGDTALAIELHEALLAHFAKAPGRYQHYEDKAREALKRLK